MSIVTAAFQKGLSKYATISGRASRPEFWWYVLAIFLIVVAAQIIDRVVITTLLGLAPGATPLSLLISLVFLVPNIAIGVRRMHDIGKSGWFLLLALIPFLGLLILIYFYTRPSDPGENAYGAPEPFITG